MRTNTFFTFFLILLSACNRDDCDVDINTDVDQNQLATDISAIDFYLTTNGIEAQEHPTGLRYVINEQGDGKNVDLCGNIIVDYKGTFLDGTEFDASSRPTGFTLRYLIEGWKIGIPLIQERGIITLYVPSVYAYGANGTTTIPENSNLIFEIELHVAQ